MEGGFCYVWRMSAMETIVEDLKCLSNERVQEAVAFVHHLKESSVEQRRRAFRETFGCMTSQEADDFQRVIDEGCERIESQ